MVEDGESVYTTPSLKIDVSVLVSPRPICQVNIKILGQVQSTLFLFFDRSYCHDRGGVEHGGV
jgi:hypothetical protein